MTATVTVAQKRRHLRGFDLGLLVAFTGSYTAGGDTITAASCGFGAFETVIPAPMFQGATHAYMFSVVPVSPDTAGRFASFTLSIMDLTYSAIAAADLAASAYPAALTGITNGISIRALVR